MTNGTATLEPMPKPTQPSGLSPGLPARYQTDWNGYLAVSALIGDRRLRTFYCDGEMEILMPSVKHELWISLLRQLIETFTIELRIERRCAGTNEPRIRGKLDLDLRVDPPPDLALEVEITSSVEKRMRVYAGLGVPEVWRFDGARLTVNQLVSNGEYVVVDRSRFFPMMPMSEWVRFMRMHEQMGDTSLMIAFQDWVRQQIAAGWPDQQK